MLWSVISAVNDERILESCLLQSPDLFSAADLILQTGFASAADAYNSGMARAKGEILVFVHQDVYLPEGWINCVERAIEVLKDQDPNWAVLGVWGVRNDGGTAGYVYWQEVGGSQFEGGIEVATLDELVLIVRRSSALSFDESLRGFHMYGADICLEARRRGMKCYAIGAFCIHNSKGYKMLPIQFWKAYVFMMKKWKSHLPIKTTCIEITRWGWPMIKWNAIRAVNLIFRREKTKPPVSDPCALYKELVHRHSVVPQNVNF
jgi:hypothetical protein